MDPERLLAELLSLPQAERLTIIRELFASVTSPEYAARILAAALPLPPEQRRAVVDQMLASFETPLEPTREDRWLAEVERRWHAVETGAEETVDHDEALEFIFESPRKKAV